MASDLQTNISGASAPHSGARIGDVVLRTKIPRSVKVSEAPGYGQTVLSYDPGSRGAMAYMDAARELAQRGDFLPTEESGAIGVPPAGVRQEQAGAPADNHDEDHEG